MANMFANSKNLKDATGINSWDISNVENFDNMFNNTKAKLPEWNGHWEDNNTFVKNV
jgi:hypothetical protein